MTVIPDTILTMPHIDDWSIIEDDDELDVTSIDRSGIFRDAPSSVNASAPSVNKGRPLPPQHPLPYYGYPFPYPMAFPPMQAYPVPPVMYPHHPAMVPYPHSFVPPESQPVESIKAKDLVTDVTNRDVLCGRGAPTNHHEGNIHFREIVAKYQSEYLAARRSDKPEIAMKVLQQVRQEGGRFLRRNKHHVGINGNFAWEEISEQRAYEKACQALRDTSADDARRFVAAEGLASVSMDYTESS